MGRPTKKQTAALRQARADKIDSEQRAAKRAPMKPVLDEIKAVAGKFQSPPAKKRKIASSSAQQATSSVATTSQEQHHQFAISKSKPRRKPTPAKKQQPPKPRRKAKLPEGRPSPLRKPTTRPQQQSTFAADTYTTILEGLTDVELAETHAATLRDLAVAEAVAVTAQAAAAAADAACRNPKRKRKASTAPAPPIAPQPQPAQPPPSPRLFSASKPVSSVSLLVDPMRLSPAGYVCLLCLFYYYFSTLNF